MKDNGKKIYKMVKESNVGKMDLNMKEIIVKANKHGYGVYKWADGSRFDGQWSENKISGLGTYSWLDGRQYKGEWKNNNMEGFGFYSWKDGRKYEGQYREDK